MVKQLSLALHPFPFPLDERIGLAGHASGNSVTIVCVASPQNGLIWALFSLSLSLSIFLSEIVFTLPKVSGIHRTIRVLVYSRLGSCMWCAAMKSALRSRLMVEPLQSEIPGLHSHASPLKSWVSPCHGRIMWSASFVDVPAEFHNFDRVDVLIVLIDLDLAADNLLGVWDEKTEMLNIWAFYHFCLFTLVAIFGILRTIVIFVASVRRWPDMFSYLAVRSRKL